MKNIFTIFLILTIFGCSKKEDSDETTSSSRGQTPDRTEEEVPREIKDPELVVVSTLMNELQMGLKDTNLTGERANAFVNAEVCDSMRVYLDHFGVGGCQHACEDTTFNRNCSSKQLVTQCQDRKFDVSYSKHLLKWDLSTLSSTGEGISTYTIDAAGTVARDGEGKIDFDCSMEIKGRNDRTFSIISCGQSLNLNCQIMGQEYGCRELLKYVVRQKNCAKAQ